MANVFLSHRGADAALATKLATELTAHGHNVWLDVWDIKVGDQIVTRMNAGLSGSIYVIVCYSSAGMAPWMDIEWASALARQLNGEGIRILPARLSGIVAPAILAGTKYADLIHDWNQGILDLLKAIV